MSKRMICLLVGLSLLISGCSTESEPVKVSIPSYEYSLPEQSSASSAPQTSSADGDFIVSIHENDDDLPVSIPFWGMAVEPEEEELDESLIESISTSEESSNTSSTAIAPEITSTATEITSTATEITSIQSDTGTSVLETNPPETVMTTSAPITVHTSTEPAPVQEQRASILWNYSEKYFYNTLSANCQEAYNRIARCFEQGTYSCNLEGLGISVDELWEVFRKFEYENPQFMLWCETYSWAYRDNNTSNLTGFWLKSYQVVDASVQEKVKETLDACISEARSYQYGYDQLKFIHDWIIDRCAYQNSDTISERRLDGVAYYGLANCQGYSMTFMYLAQSLGYSCISIIGGNGSHLWNVVELNGIWYNVDVTWDDPVNASSDSEAVYNYFLCGAIDDTSHSVDPNQDDPMVA